MRFSIALFGLLLLFANCVGTKSSNEKNDDGPLPVLDGSYLIVSINDQNVENSGLTMNFDRSTGNVSGNAGCNQYFWSFLQENKSLFFSKVGATKKYCQDSGIRKLEEQLLALLSSIKSMDSNKSGNFNFYNDQSKLLLSITILN